MHRFVGTVFKVLGISIIMMIVLDVLFVLVDTVTVNSRIESLSLVIRDELSRNNSIPEDIDDLFESQLRQIVDKSYIATKYDWNLDKSITVDGKTYPPINSANVKDYGDILGLVIRVEMHPRSLMFFRDPSKNGGSFLGTNLLTYTRVYVYEVPALRYLK